MDRLDPYSLGIYVVTAAGLVTGRSHLDVARAAIEGGATALQLRAPELSGEELGTLATQLVGLCREAGVLFIVNDDVEAAVESGAGGVHLGQGDDFERARGRLGPKLVLGISVQDEGQAALALRAEADYLGVTVWASPTKPEARPIGLAGLSAIARSSRLPVVGIGGIYAENTHAVFEAGAAGIAVVSAVAAAEDSLNATRRLRHIVDRARAEFPVSGGAGPSDGGSQEGRHT